MFHPEMHGSLAFFRAILNGEKLKRIPNDSMSFIDVRDLAELEIAALENTNARGKIISDFFYNILESLEGAHIRFSPLRLE